MRDNVLDLLQYLFHHYRAAEVTDAGTRAGLRDELAGAGFPDHEIAHVLLMLMPQPPRAVPRRVVASASPRLH